MCLYIIIIYLHNQYIICKHPNADKGRQGDGVFVALQTRRRQRDGVFVALQTKESDRGQTEGRSFCRSSDKGIRQRDRVFAKDKNRVPLSDSFPLPEKTKTPSPCLKTPSPCLPLSDLGYIQNFI